MAPQQRTALVTGAAGGIGRAIACALAAAGPHVAVADVDEAGLAGTAAAIGADVQQLVLDVTDATAVGAAVSQVHDAFGAPHVVVNAAGISTMALLVDLSERDWDAMMAVNAKGTFLVMRAKGASFHDRAAGLKLRSSTSAYGGTASRVPSC